MQQRAATAAPHTETSVPSGQLFVLDDEQFLLLVKISLLHLQSVVAVGAITIKLTY